MQRDVDERRFGFGANWRRLVEALDPERVEQAERSLAEMLSLDDLNGRRFLDAGSGSGLFSLAARRMGASVVSFDVDPDSVACTSTLSDRYFPGDPDWLVKHGSLLDGTFLATLGDFDVVYCWGVAHHTGNMWHALDNLSRCVGPGGSLIVAIYNDQGWVSSVWTSIKRKYNVLPSPVRPLFAALFVPLLWGPAFGRDILLGQPGRTWRTYKQQRGMSPLVDVTDWVGGYPFEVAKPDEIFHFFFTRGFFLEKIRTAGGRAGNNEFTFRRDDRG